MLLYLRNHLNEVRFNYARDLVCDSDHVLLKEVTFMLSKKNPQQHKDNTI